MSFKQFKQVNKCLKDTSKAKDLKTCRWNKKIYKKIMFPLGSKMHHSEIRSILVAPIRWYQTNEYVAGKNFKLHSTIKIPLIESSSKESQTKLYN